MNCTYYLLDVFTSEPFSGNQLAVFPDARDIDPALFQKIAKEFNLSETVFLFPPNQDTHHTMRVFTPGSELKTAGHPTIGTAYLLAKESGSEKIILHQKIGDVAVDVKYQDGEPDMIIMNQNLPAYGPIHREVASFAEMLSLEKDEIDNLPIQEVSCGNNILFIPIKSTESLKKIKVRTDLLEKISANADTTQLYCFSVNKVDNGDVQGRMFAPLLGIYEDPATGSANGPLACYLAKHNVLQMPVLSLQGYEMGSPSQLHLDLSFDAQNNIDGVKVGGKCKLVGKGELFLGQ